ncbi:uncharacterized protein LOC134618341 [Pelmatolapia mariae]|uniref:uncharacterized protein LOC134618341 n=1 Tax=Pelmatolapia mariae TaxID=158779 RepID=UPI002FE66CBE
MGSGHRLVRGKSPSQIRGGKHKTNIQASRRRDRLVQRESRQETDLKTCSTVAWNQETRLAKTRYHLWKRQYSDTRRPSHSSINAPTDDVRCAAAVLVHGDWYFCCKIDEKNIKLPCKPEMNEAEKAKRAEMMNSSKVSGYTLLLAIVVAAFLTLWSGWRRFFEKKLGIYGRKSLYYQVVLEEEEKILEDLLRKAVNENLIREITKNINKQDWDGCLNAAQEMINKAKLQQTTATKDDNTGMSEGNVKGGEQAQQGPARHQAQNLELQSLKEDNKETTPLFD